jgi:DNA polymerase-3 subunit delta'
MSQADQIEELPDIDGDFPPRYTRALIGHQAAVDSFSSACQSGRMPHAWLLTGPKGVGKASFAYMATRGLMAAKTPEKISDFRHADDSEDQRLVETEAHPDMYVLKRRFNPKTDKFTADIPVDSVRQMKQFFTLSASRGGWRVAIIDSIDEMNKSGVNGLLKLLEEPPERTLFFVICQHPGRLLDTIKSRCRTLSLNALSTEDLVTLVQQRLQGVDRNTAAAAAYLADGSAGRALDLVDQGGFDLYRDMIEVFAGLPMPEIEKLHALASRFGARAEPASFDIFCYLFSNWLFRVIHGRATGQHQQPVFEGEAEVIARVSQQMALEPATRLWEKVNQQMREVNALNLDKKQAVLDWVDDLSELVR